MKLENDPQEVSHSHLGAIDTEFYVCFAPKLCQAGGWAGAEWFLMLLTPLCLCFLLVPSAQLCCCLILSFGSECAPGVCSGALYLSAAGQGQEVLL